MTNRLYVLARGRGRAVIAFLAVAGLSFLGCGSSSIKSTSSTELPHPAPAREIKPLNKSLLASGDLKPVQWRVFGIPKGQEVRILAEGGYCAGESPPEFQAVRVIERKGLVYIAPYVQKPTPRSHEACGGIGGFQWGIVEISQVAQDVKIYDSTTSPPTLRWPKQGGS